MYSLLTIMAVMTLSDHCESGSIVLHMADDKKAKRRQQNVEAAKKSYETKKKERNELQEKNTSLVAEQMALLLEKSRLEDQVQRCSQLLTAIEHTCSNDGQLSDCLIVGSPTRHISDMTTECTNIPDNTDHRSLHINHDVTDHREVDYGNHDVSDHPEVDYGNHDVTDHPDVDYGNHDVTDHQVGHYNNHDATDHRVGHYNNHDVTDHGADDITHDLHSNGFTDQTEIAEAVKNLQHHSNIALDLSSKASVVHQARTASRGSIDFSGREEAYDFDDGLNIGATQEVELTTRRRKYRRQDGGIPDQQSVVKRNRRERLSPNSCARSLLDSKRGSQLSCDNGRRFPVQ